MPEWTAAQKDAIYAHGGTILVSAAAGSGKTAVLVERVIQLITRKENPVDVNRLLIVTFTNAAAAEMKSRIAASLRGLLRADPDNQNARRQLSLLSGADICTIDSFCLKLVRENFFSLGISADFRLLDESENDLIATDAIDRVLDTFYADKNTDFMHLAEAFTQPDNDKDLFSLIKSLLRFMYAQPFPFVWLEQVINYYHPCQSFEDTVWKSVLTQEIGALLATAERLAANAVSVLPEDDLYEKYRQMLTADRQLIQNLKTLLDTSWDDFLHKGYPVPFSRFPVVKSADEDVKSYLKICRDHYKKIITAEIAAFLVADTADYAEDVKQLYPMYQALLQVLRAVDAEMRAEKDSRSAYSFADIEHFAIALLFVQNHDGQAVKSDLAQSLEDRYYEILVDEYQDTNEAQDRLFSYLSNGNNRFMVGDVKQSIYRFRLAMPQIFTQKKNSYMLYDAAHPEFPAKIVLDKNFRSRNGICAYVNYVFSLFMTEQVGELDYTEEEYLHAGADYPSSAEPSAQLFIIDGVSGEDTDTIEAIKIAETIRQKVNSGELIKDGSDYRPVQYGDFAILMRSLRTHAPAYAAVLQNMRIPVLCDNSTSLFDNGEIQLLISLLQVIDNPMQDIPLLTAMTSPVYGFTPDELAEIKIQSPHAKSFYAAVFRQNNLQNEKCAAFIEDLRRLRTESVAMSVSGFIRKLIQDKGILAYIFAMGGGTQREANIERFISIADRFDQGSGVGLTSFLHYLDSIMHSDQNTDSAPVIAADTNAVKIMSIHHSKGLEFPICILAGAARKYNSADLRGKMLQHPTLGIASKCHNEDGFYEYQSLPYAAIKRKTALSMMSENLRVLYVAMTRAKEQFITFATVPKLESRLKSAASCLISGKPEPYFCSKIYDDAGFILMAALCHKDGGILRERVDIPVPVLPSDFAMKIIIDAGEAAEQAELPEQEFIYDTALLTAMDEKLSYQYPYAELSKISAKRTASELDTATQGFAFFANSVPAFLNKGGLTPAQKGTAMHTFMQFCDYTAAKAQPEAEIARLVTAGYISQEEADSLNREKLRLLFNSDFANRIFNSLHVYRELKVSSFVPACTIENVKSEAKIFIQGIADCVFEEKDGLVLLDYKTDHVKNETELLERYEKQLAFYKSAVEKTLKKPVKEVYLYSFALSKPCRYK